MNRKGNTILKSDSLDQAFEKIKLAFDQDQISSNDYIQCYQLHKRTIELKNNIMKSNTEKTKISKPGSFDQFFDKAKMDLTKACDNAQLAIKLAIRKANISKPIDPYFSNLLTQAKYASENDLRKSMEGSKLESVRTAARIELRRRGKIV